jgi:F1F0 ATPase subunit 2
MNLPSFNTPPALAELLTMTVYLAVGIALGILYFRGLWWNVAWLTDDRRVMATIASIFGRFALLAGLLTLASLQGALPLLSTALGVLAGRSIVMRSIRDNAP